MSRALLIVALLCQPLAAAPPNADLRLGNWANVAAASDGSPTIEIPAEIQATTEYLILNPKTDAKAITYIGTSGVEPFPAAMLRDARTFALPTRGLPAGRYKFVAVASLNDEHTRVDFVVTVGTPAPGPATPVPGPTVPPGPVTPPLPLLGMRVLILDETNGPGPGTDRQKWQQQVTAMRSPAVKAYLDSKTLKGADGSPQWRKYDPNSSLSNMPREWQDLRAKLQPAKLPWFGIADAAGNVVYQGEPPTSDAELLATFQKYGG